MIIEAAKRLEPVHTYYFAKKLTEIAGMNIDGGQQVINLGIGSPDLLPPDSVTQALQASVQKEGAHRYQPYKGLPSLRAAFAEWYIRHFGVMLNPDEEILPMIGSKEAVMHISMSFINPGDQVLVPDPGYPSYAMCTRLAGGVDKSFDLKEENGWLPDLDELSHSDLSNTKLMWLNYPNMPTGVKMDSEFLNDLIQFALTYKILICYDNPYSLLTKERPLSVFNGTDAKKCCIELTSLSKNYNMAGWRVGAITGEKDLIDTVMTFKSNMDSGMFRPIQEAAIQALYTDQEWLDELNHTYSKRRKAAESIFRLMGLEFASEGNGLFLWGKIPSHLPDAAMLTDALLYNSRVFITPGHIFGKNGSRYMRISLCSPEEDFIRAAQRIESQFLSERIMLKQKQEL